MPGPWVALPSTGLANRIFATPDVVLRVGTDHPDGLVDARTESVAAPVARAAGILTPRLIAFDDTRTLVERPFSLWERVHGEPLAQRACRFVTRCKDLSQAWASNLRSAAHADVRRLTEAQQQALRRAYVEALAREARNDASALSHSKASSTPSEVAEALATAA